MTYDIADTEGPGAYRLRRVADVCAKYGRRVHLSVFECRLSPERLARMVNEIQDAIDNHHDSVIVYRFPGNLKDTRMRFGRTQPHELGEPWIL